MAIIMGTCKKNSKKLAMNPRRLVKQTFLFTVVVVVYHLVLRWWMLHQDLVLGVVRPGTKVYRIVPIYAYFDRHVNVWLAVCIVAVIAYLRWVQKNKRLHTWKLVGWFLVIVATVAMLDGGPRRLWRPFDVLHDSDYIGAVDAVESPRVFLRDYVEIRETLPMHCQTHPPGAVLFLWLTDHYLSPSPEAASIVTILFAALSIPAVVGLARLGAGERHGPLAACLFLLAPNVVLFTATSMEAVFMVPMIWTVYLLFLAVAGNSGEVTEESKDRPRYAWFRSPWLLGFLAGLCASVAAMMTFSVAIIALWAILLGVVVLVKRPDRFAATFTALAVALATSILFYLLIYLYSGYNLIEMLRSGIGSHESIMSGGNYASARQYFHLVVGNLMAFLIGSGIPIAVLFLGTARRDLLTPGLFVKKETSDENKTLSHGRLLNITFVATLSITLLAPLYTLEVERIWIFLVPFLVIGAVRRLENESHGVAGATLRLAMILTAIQTITMETFLETLW